MVQHIIEIRHLPLLIPNNRKPQIGVADLVDVADPAAVGIDCVCGEADELDIAFREFGFESGEGA